MSDRVTSASKILVLTDARGAIIGAGRFEPIRSDDGEVQVRIRPDKGQRLIEVPASEVGRLSSVEDFQRLIAEYHLPPGKTALVRKRGNPTASKRPARRR